MDKVRTTTRDAIAIATIASLPVNALDAGLRAGLAAAVQQVDADPDICAIVIATEGRTFIAAIIPETSARSRTSTCEEPPDDCSEKPPADIRLQQILSRVCPSVIDAVPDR